MTFSTTEVTEVTEKGIGRLPNVSALSVSSVTSVVHLPCAGSRCGYSSDPANASAAA